MQKKQFVLDTNILMSYPDSIYGFADNIVIITPTTLEELDRKKNSRNGSPEAAFQARAALAALEKLRLLAIKNHESPESGIHINQNAGLVKIETKPMNPEQLQLLLPFGWTLDNPDNRILATSKALGAILVTEDNNLLFKAFAIGVVSQRYKNVQLDPDDAYTGRGEIMLPSETILSFVQNQIPVPLPEEIDAVTLCENEYLTIHANEDKHYVAYARYAQGQLFPLQKLPTKCKISPRNVGQKFAIDALLNKDITCVCLEGCAGTAKTFLSVVAAMQGLMLGTYEQFIATRNNVGIGEEREIGALPGSETEKVSPLLRGLTDNLRAYLKIQGTASEDINASIEDYIDSGIISIEAMSFMRGRSLNNQIILLDECQNATPHQMVSILTRAGQNTKIIIAGDTSQIDQHNLTKATCGLTAAKYAMKGDPLFAYIRFNDETECERSEFARHASQRFENIFGRK